MKLNVTSLASSVSADQRDWCERYTFREWPEWLIQNGVVELDAIPTTQEWWRLFYAVYERATGREPPELTPVLLN
jgi:hypothetical protein